MKGEQIEQFIDALRTNPDAPAPAGLDSETAALLRMLVLSRAAQTIPPEVQDRVWAAARAAAQLQQQTNGRDISLSLSEAHTMEETDMQHTVTRRLKSTQQRFYSGMFAASLIGIVLLLGVLILIQNRRAPLTHSGGIARLTPTVSPTQDLYVLYNAQPIQIGETVRGTLVDEASSVSYLFQTDAALKVLLVAYSEDFVPGLTPQNITSNRGGGGGGGGSEVNLPATTIWALDLPANSQILVTVDNDPNDPHVRGDFRLSVLPLPAQTSLAPDQPVTMTLDEQNPVSLAAFEGTAGEQISLSVQGDTAYLDTKMWLLDANGSPLEIDDDSGLGLSPELNRVYLPEDGLYTVLIEAKGYAPASGDISLTFNVEPVPSGANPPDAENATPIELGQTVQGELSPQHPAQTYSFATGDQETRVAVFALSPNFAPQIGAGFEAAGGGGGGGGSGDGSIVLPATSFSLYTVPAHAEGWIEVSAAPGGSDSGRFLFSVMAAPEEPTIMGGKTVEGNLSPESPFMIDAFRANAGDQVSIQVNADAALDLDMMLLNADSMTIAFDTDSGAGASPEITGVTIPSDGLTYIVLYITGEDQAGAYVLTLAATTP